MPERMLHLLDLTRRQTLALCADVTEALFHEAPTDRVHSPAWMVGHLTLYDAYLADLLDAGCVTLGERWERAFGKDSAPGGDGGYGKDELLDRLDKTRAVFITNVAMLGEGKLEAPNPDPGTAAGVPTIGDLLQYAVWHEGFHAGQLSSWRKHMGLPAVGLSFNS